MTVEQWKLLHLLLSEDESKRRSRELMKLHLDYNTMLAVCDGNNGHPKSDLCQLRILALFIF